MCTYCKDDQVSVKLTDFAESTFVNLQGFNRKRCCTPGHISPEVLKYPEKELCGEMVCTNTLLCYIYVHYSYYYYYYNDDIQRSTVISNQLPCGLVF